MIEMAFSKLKAHLRRIGATTFEELLHEIGDICGMFTAAECWNFFKNAGYVSTQCRNALTAEALRKRDETQ